MTILFYFSAYMSVLVFFKLVKYIGVVNVYLWVGVKMLIDMMQMILHDS